VRRRPKEHPAGAPPAELVTFPGGSTREKLAWVRDRERWWDDNRDEDDAGWLSWLIAGWDQVEPLPWCGSVGAPCGDGECMCVAWPEHLDARSNPLTDAPTRKATP
jgi:hypothetical protein